MAQSESEPASLGERAAETERVREIQDKQAPRYVRQISFFERILLGGGREWVCSQTEGFEVERLERSKRGIVERVLARKAPA